MYKVSTKTNLAYAQVGGQPLLADLYLPDTPQAPPVVVYMHGGGFHAGSKSEGAESRIAAMAAHGVAVLSIDYRLTPAHFPDQVHDAKAAVRWLRAMAKDLGINGQRIGVWGASAGAILASLVALTEGERELEGSVGEHLDQSSSVQAVVTWFGVFDFLASAARSGLEARLMPHEFSATFLGLASHTDVTQAVDSARRASPLTWAKGGAAPFLIAHGDRDRMAPIAESQTLHDAIVRAGGSSMMLKVGGAGHEGDQFESAANIALTAAFLKTHLAPR